MDGIAKLVKWAGIKVPEGYAVDRIDVDVFGELSSFRAEKVFWFIWRLKVDGRNFGWVTRSAVCAAADDFLKDIDPGWCNG